MKKVFLLIFLITLISCKNSNQPKQTYANVIEKNVIGEMICWSDYESEGIMNQIVNADDKEKRNELFDRKFDLDNKACEIGRKRLINDTVFINLIRNDSLLKDYTNQRNKLAIKVLSFRNKVPFFEEYIDNIGKGIIEYEYLFVDEFGINEYPPRKTDEFDLRNKTFFKNYTEILKESYKLLENSKVKEDYITNLNKTLVSIEKIDRELWLVKYYFDAKKKLETEKLEDERKKKVDSLLQ